VKNAYDSPVLCRRTSALFCEGKGTFGGGAFGRGSDIARTINCSGNVSADEHLNRWIKWRQKRCEVPRAPSRNLLAGYGERDKFGLALNDLVAKVN